MNVNETALLEKLMNGEREAAAHTEDATEKIRTRTQMRDLTQEFRRVSLFLEWISFVGGADDRNIARDQFPFLPLALRRNQRAAHDNRSASAEALDGCVIRQRIFLRNDLKIAQRGAVIQLDERKILRIAAGAHPSLDAYSIKRCHALQCILNRSWRKLRHVDIQRFFDFARNDKAADEMVNLSLTAANCRAAVTLSRR